MIGIVRRAIKRRHALRRDADELIALHGREAWQIARDLAWDCRADEDRAMHHRRVAALIDKKLGIGWQPDTATRWLESRPS